jgi:serine/threonine-protein kinase RsbW
VSSTLDPDAVAGQGPTSVLTLRFPARPEYLVLGRLVLTGLSRAQPIDEDSLSDLKLALTEGCTNSVRHAYAIGEGSVVVRYELGPNEIAVEIEDDGRGFDAGSVGQPVDPEALDEGGLGLAIIRAVSDECHVGPRAAGAGSRVRFVKRLEHATGEGR